MIDSEKLFRDLESAVGAFPQFTPKQVGIVLGYLKAVVKGEIKPADVTYLELEFIAAMAAVGFLYIAGGRDAKPVRDFMSTTITTAKPIQAENDLPTNDN